jgi:hypothetical protein
MDESYSQSSTVVNRSSVSENDPPVLGEEIPNGARTDEDSTIPAVPSWYIRVLMFPTIYGELSAARIPADFAPVRTRLQQEWTFDAGVVCQFTFFLTPC